MGQPEESNIFFVGKARITACINFCEGTSTENLEPGGLRRLIYEAEELRRQNQKLVDLLKKKEAEKAELLAACRAVDAHLRTTFPPYPPGESPFDKVRSVVAKMETQP